MVKKCSCGARHSLDDFVTEISGVYTEFDLQEIFFKEHLVEFKCDACGSHIVVDYEDVEGNNVY